jgi:arsenite-transporting ATPase
MSAITTTATQVTASLTVSSAALLERPTRFLFFTGKGGVGKTSLACAVAVALADQGLRVLLVSTDPASNLEEVLGQRIGGKPTPISGAARLLALNIDPRAAALAYRERIVGPYRAQMPESVIHSMEEQLSGACTTEVAAFDEFAGFLGDPTATAAFDHVIFDTAPTGHTLRLLSLGSAWTGFLAANTSGTSCLGPLASLERQRAVYERAVATLADETQTTLVLVTRPQAQALAEAERTSGELAALGVHNQRLVLNGVFRAADHSDRIAMELERRGDRARARYDRFIKSLPLTEVDLRAHNLIGLPALRTLLANGDAERDAQKRNAQKPNGRGTLPPFESLSALVDELARTERGVIMTVGKGGVGKTTMAAAIATGLVRRGLRVHLTTTDPAAHVVTSVGAMPGLQVSSIDPQAETRAYAQHVMATVGADLDADGRALLVEDLRSPCTEEIAVFRAFARIVAQGQDRIVVLDTAPTGHTLLLLDATQAYHREIARKADDLPDEVLHLLPRLRNAEYTKVLIVTLPEPTPVHEAAMLQADLRRAGIEPFAWLINQSLAQSATSDPLLEARGKAEMPFIRAVADDHSKRTAIVPWVAEEPLGFENLASLLRSDSTQ